MEPTVRIGLCVPLAAAHPDIGAAERGVQQAVVDRSVARPLARADLWHEQEQQGRHTHEVYAAIRFRQWMVTADPSAMSAEIGLARCGAKSKPHSVCGL
jgi:hypothetical protein